ncbi:sugar-transfer associated ATP-grasp domain-containing protein [Luteithermobacter gelatinilyticus]|uniref:sugar-transfer associated ATP-grasp domain-containing protein n=1 Tax=Luteithermobacter gelatinilyticus TaxID=2582913 RepID=UPI001107501A|nr:sugar-transfer associated ATP-grasp domain-containing protein [Luteithermobacter gelatinilyticus]
MRMISKGRDFFRFVGNEWQRYRARPLKVLYNWLYAYLVRKFSPAEIHLLGLADPSFSFRTHYNTISKEMADRFYMRKIARSHLCMVGDKSIFYQLCRNYGLPIPQIYGVYDIEGGWDEDGQPLVSQSDWSEFISRKLPQETLVKLSLGLLGQGIKLLHKTPEGDVVYGDEKYSLFGFLEKLDQECRKEDFELDLMSRAPQKAIFQERLSNHRAITELTGFTMLQTVRVCTCLTAGGDVEILFSFFKLAGEEGLADAFNAGKTGNSLAQLELQSGKLVRVRRMNLQVGYLEDIDCHPKTGMRFADFRIPYPQDIIDLAQKAARRFLPHECLGWDIAITDAGPVLLEGNAVWTPMAPFSLPKDRLKAHGLI